MTGRLHLLILALHLAPLMEHVSGCPPGFSKIEKDCIDEDECNPPSDYYDDDPVTPQICGENAACINTEGSFYCQCALGFRSSSQRMNFTAASPEKCIDTFKKEGAWIRNQSVSEVATICLMQRNTSPSHRVDQAVDCGLWNVVPLLFNDCVKLMNIDRNWNTLSHTSIQSIPNMLNMSDINECLENKDTCCPNAECHNVLGSYSCICNEGFVSSTGAESFTFGQRATCEALHLAPLMEHVSGCPPGFSKIEKDCIDEDECNPPSDYYDDDPVTPQICGENAACINTEGSFYCQCALGFRSSSQRMNFTAASPEKCIDTFKKEGAWIRNQSVSEVATICLMQRNTSPSHRVDQAVDCGLWNVVPLLFNDCVKLMNIDRNWNTLSHTSIQSIPNMLNMSDINECLENKDTCCPNAECHNVLGSYSCICNEGFVSSTGAESFTFGQRATCEDRNECVDDSTICGKHTQCVNTPGSYSCVCNPGFGLKSGKAQFTENGESCEEITDQKATTDQTATTDSEDAQGAKDLCKINRFICGGNGTCHNAANGGHRCACHAGFTNYGDPQGRCTELNCDTFASEKHLKMVIPGLQDAVALMRTSCLELSESNTAEQVDGEALLETLLSAIDRLLSRGPLNNNKEVSVLLDLVETALRIIGPLLKHPETRRFKTHTEVELLVQRNASSPQGPLTLSSTHAQLDSHWETAAGDTSYPGFATVSLLSYKGLETSTNNSFSGLKAQEGHSFQINSKVVTATISNKDTSFLKEPVTFTFSHLKESDEGSYTCVYWDAELGEGTWSDRGCFLLQSNATHTVCSCYHLSSFAVLMALYEFKTSKSTQKTGESQI
ncbi:adhesion G protein-coupled receptor E1-like isoform X1 [Salvelinus alpinus]|uniref:adhesion G protein-coupled receptor E1-like isoform X1 n=1 Tax=Salvelinus alpinus TaxID=8036 RepID=UPI0039FBAA23